MPGQSKRAHAALGVCLQWDCNLAVLPSFSATRFGNRKVLNSVTDLWLQPAISPARIWSSIPSHFLVSWNPFHPLAWTICSHLSFSPLLYGPALQPALNLSALPGFPIFPPASTTLPHTKAGAASYRAGNPAASSWSTVHCVESRALKLISLQKLWCATGLLLPCMEKAAALFTRWLSLLRCFGLEKTQTRCYKGCYTSAGQAASIVLQITAMHAEKVGKQVGWKQFWHLSHLQWITESTGNGIINYSVLLNILFMLVCNSKMLHFTWGISFFSQSAERDLERSCNASCLGQNQLHLKPSWQMSH